MKKRDKKDAKERERNVSLVLRVFYIASILILLLCMSVSAAEHHVGSGETYQTIQEAINAASSGDTIIVNSGTYYENVNVNKQLILRGDGDLPVVDAGGSGSAITINIGGGNT